MWKLLLNFIPGIGPFLSSAASFVAAHWKFFVIAAMIGCIAYQNTQSKRWFFMVPTIPYYEQLVAEQKTEITKLNDVVTTATTANTQLTNTITALNGDISQWQEKSAELQNENAALQSTVNVIRTNTNTKVTTILNGPVPATCEASIDYLRKQIGGLAWPSIK